MAEPFWVYKTAAVCFWLFAGAAVRSYTVIQLRHHRHGCVFYPDVFYADGVDLCASEAVQCELFFGGKFVQIAEKSVVAVFEPRLFARLGECAPKLAAVW